MARAEAANTALRKALHSPEYAASIQQRVHSMKSWSATELDVQSLLSSWIDRVEPQPLHDIPETFHSGTVEDFSTDELVLVPFVDCCDPDSTTWMPLPPQQVAAAGFDPQSEADLYESFSSVSATIDDFEHKQQATLSSYAALGEAGVRVSNRVAVVPESTRVPPARGKVYCLTTPVPTLVDYHAPLDTDLNLPFIAHIVGITPPCDKSAPLAHSHNATFPDLELVSDVFLGARSKAHMPMHSVFCPHGESLRLNLSAIEDQALDLETRNYATLHVKRPYSPCRYVSNGTTERKDDPSRPRLTDNKSAPLKPFKDADGVEVTSQNHAYRQQQKQAPTQAQADSCGTVPTSTPANLKETRSASSPIATPAGFPADPKERKPGLHHIAMDAMLLRHVADKTGEPMYICKFDMASFFDQLPIPHHERHLNLRMLRPQHLFTSATIQDWPAKSTHMEHKRMGFGGTRNSNIGQRFANLIVFVVSYFLDLLEQPDRAHETGYMAHWLQQRTQLNAHHYYRQDRKYSANMYTDDLIGIVVTLRTAMNFVVAVYLMAQHMNVLLAGRHKMAIGAGLRALGGSVFVMLGVVAIPAHKRLHGVHQLQLVLAGQCTFEEYEKLLGLLVHCWILAFMANTMLDDMYKPLAYMRLSRQGTKNKLQPDNHPYLHGTWHAWLHTLLTTSAAKFSAVMGHRNATLVDAATVHIYGDAFRRVTSSSVEAGLGGFAEGAWWHYSVPSADAEVLDITKLEALVIPSNFITFDSRLPKGDELATSQIAVHGDGLASIQNLPKARVPNSEMRVVRDLTLTLPQFQCRAPHVVVAHTYGLGNMGDAPSRNKEDTIIDICRALGIRPRRLATPPSVHALVRLAAQRIRALTPEERSAAPAFSCNEAKDGPSTRSHKAHYVQWSRWCIVMLLWVTQRPGALTLTEQVLTPAFSCNVAGDGPNTVHCTRTPPKRRKLTEPASISPSSPAQVLQTRLDGRSPPSSPVASAVPMFRSPAKHATLAAQTVHVNRSPPPTAHKPRPQLQSTTMHRTRSLSDSAQLIHEQRRRDTTSSLSDLITSAYPSDSPYAIQPPNMQEFEEMLDNMYDNMQLGIPDSTEAHERSAVNRYWAPFCTQMGMSFMRPPHSGLTPEQKRAEHNMRAIFLPWTHVRMKGIKQDKANPNSVMSVLRLVINMLDRENDEKTYSSKPKQVLKGMLTAHVAEYGPLLPDQSMAPPKRVITALLSIPDNTKLGRYVLHWSDPEMVDFRAMYEVSLQSGLRLDECTVGIKKCFDKRKMSRRSLMWKINNTIIISPTDTQLRSLSTAHGDGAILLPACSKTDAWGNKHGHKAMFFPFHEEHTWNAASALRTLELTRPVLSADEREQTPLFRLADGSPFPATRVRTLLHYMYRHPTVLAVTPREHLTDKGAPKYSFHSGRKLFATSLAKSGADRSRIQSMARWITDESVDIYDQMSLEDNGRYVTAAYNNCPASITPRLLSKMNDIPIDNNDVYVAWAQECFVDIVSFTPDW